MHSSGMRTTRLLPVSPSMHCSKGGIPARGGCIYLEGVPTQGVPAQGGVPAWGVPALGGVPTQGDVPAQGVCTCPGTPPCEQNDRLVTSKI